MIGLIPTTRKRKNRRIEIHPGNIRKKIRTKSIIRIRSVAAAKTAGISLKNQKEKEN
jgi:hypothetical protein